MKRSLLFGLSGLLLMNGLILGTAAYSDATTCREDEATVCYDRSQKAYHIEADAHLSVQVPTQAFGDALLNLWATAHPDRPDVLKVVLSDEDPTADIVYLSQDQAAFESGSWLVLDDRLNETLLAGVSPELNLDGLTYLPMAGEGFAFVTNLTALQALGADVTDADKDNLPDAFDTFDKIIAAQKNWPGDKRKLVLSLDEPFAFYPFLSASGWQLFESYDAYAPGFETEAFLDSLRFIKTLSAEDWSPAEDNTAASYGWDFSQSLSADDFIFNLASSWMFLESYQADSGSAWAVSHFPAKDADSDPLTPFLSAVRGYAVRNTTAFPSAATEVLRLIRTSEGLQAFVDTTAEIPLAKQDTLESLTFNQPFRGQFALAFSQSRSEPLIGLANDPDTPALSLYLEIDLMGALRELWDGSITPEEAQIRIAQASDAWLYQHSDLVLKEAKTRESQ